MLSGIDQTARVLAGNATQRLSRRTLLVGLLAATAASWSPRPAAAGSWVAVTNLRTYREALGMLTPRFRHALIDVRADWCAPCLRMEREVFPHPAVRRMLEDVALIKVDVTAMDNENRELLGHLRADGPPTLFVVDTASGAEYARTRSVGSLKRRELMRRLRPFVDS
ncbi:thioredoxin family protein [Corticibacterium sp. UT-5YL-CI-8]|nr:thioredoxin family protein [Tianweitania sp. UT-5YL-CI-8]